MSGVGTAAQATQLAALQAKYTTAVATYNTAVTTMETSRNALMVAESNLNNYRNYYYGNNEKSPIVVDAQNTDVT